MTLTNEPKDAPQFGFESLPAAGYTNALELLRLAFDFYADQGWSAPRSIPFGSPLENHTVHLPIKRIQGA